MGWAGEGGRDIMVHSHQANAKSESDFSWIFGIAWCEWLNGKQHNPYVSDIAFAFAFAWCEWTIIKRLCLKM